jgi:hypothetical protein
MDRPPIDTRELLDAFARVQENHGCAGVDAVTVDQFAESAPASCAELAGKLRDSTYRALPLRRIVVEKRPSAETQPGPGTQADTPPPPQINPAGHRTLLVPAVRDRVLQTAVARRLSKSFEEEFLETSFAYRPHRGVDRAIARIRMLRDQGYRSIVDADIRSFFDNVSFPLLESQLATRGEPDWLLSLVAEWIRCPAWDGGRLRARDQGLPQGSPLSPLLANLFLMPLDSALAARDWKLVRYADDFVVLTRTEAEATAALGMVTEELAKLQLELNAAKTRITNFELGLHFLGVFFQSDQIWTPWRDQRREQGRILGMARPMPPELLERFRSPRSQSPMESALLEAGLRYIPRTTSQHEEGNTDVAYLYLTEQGSVLRKSGDRLLLEHEDRIVLDMPYHKLEQVLVFGHVQITAQALVEMMEKGVDVSFLSLIHTRNCGRRTRLDGCSSATGAAPGGLALLERPVPWVAGLAQGFQHPGPDVPIRNLARAGTGAASGRDHRRQQDRQRARCGRVVGGAAQPAEGTGRRPRPLGAAGKFGGGGTCGHARHDPGFRRSCGAHLFRGLVGVEPVAVPVVGPVDAPAEG